MRRLKKQVKHQRKVICLHISCLLLPPLPTPFTLFCLAFRPPKLFVWLVGFLTSSSTTRLSCIRVPRLTSDNFMCCYTEKEQGDHDFCLSQSHYTDTDPPVGSGDQAHDLLTRSYSLYRLSYRPPPFFFVLIDYSKCVKLMVTHSTLKVHSSAQSKQKKICALY